MKCDKCDNRLELREGKIVGDNIYCHDCWRKKESKKMSVNVISSCPLHQKSKDGECNYTDDWCEGYTKSKYDDEPSEECKECRYNQFYK